MARFNFEDLGDYLADGWGYTTESTIGDLLAGKSEAGKTPSETDNRMMYLLAALVSHAKEQVAESRALRSAISGLGKQIANGIAEGEERKAKAAEKAEAAKEKAAIAERDAKLDARPVVVIQCPNDVLERIPASRLRGKW